MFANCKLIALWSNGVLRGWGIPQNQTYAVNGSFEPLVFFSVHLTASILKVTHLEQISPDKSVVEYQDSGWNLYNV